MGFRDRVAIVTGAGSGFGRGTASKLAERGAKVVIADVNETGGKEAVAEIEAAGGEAILVVSDISTADGARAVIDAAVDTFGGLDVLVNNAGIKQTEKVDTWDCAEETWDRVLRIDLKGVYLCSKFGIPKMLERGGGAIVNVASIAASVAVGGAAYAAAKGGIVAYTQHIAYELGPKGIRANCVSPGFMRTPMSTGSAEGATQDAQDAWVAGRTKNVPLGRIGEIDDIANAIVFLASDEASFITGRDLIVDGGFLVRGPNK